MGCLTVRIECANVRTYQHSNSTDPAFEGSPMNPSLSVLSLILLLPLLLSSRNASVPQDPVPPVKSPLPASPLALFPGQWTVREELVFGDRVMAGRGSMTCTWGPGKHSVLIQYESVEGPMAGFKLTEMIARDADGSYALSWVDSRSPGIKVKRGTYTNEGGFSFITPRSRIDPTRPVESSTIVANDDGGFVITGYLHDGEESAKRTMTLTFARTEGDR